MSEDQLKLRYLLERLTNNEITKAEFDELFALINRGTYEADVKAVLMDGLRNDQLPETMGQERLDTILRGILHPVPAPDLYEAEAPVRRMIFRRRFAAAAAIILLIGAGVWFGLNRTPSTDVATTKQTSKPLIDVAPGGNKAVLTLANGSAIVLDNAANGTLTQQGNVNVVKLNNGQLLYKQGDNKAGNPLTIDHSPLTYNTLSTPRGGQYQLVLPDGSKVWLNAASSIRFPTAFTGNERSVDITGEAYFEINKVIGKNGHKNTFVVNILPPTGREGVGAGRVEVLGTHFNINAYDDEAAIKTTLLEGSVKVSKDGASAVIKPGEQASLSHTSQPSHLIPVLTVDVEDVLAWKNGLFHFENADIKTVMRQLSRWYDIEVEYKGAVKNEPLIMEVPRSANLSDVLKVIESTTGLKLTIEGKKVTVL